LRRTGGIVAFDLVGDDEGYFTSKAPALRAESLAHGVLLRPLGETIYALPPSCTSDDECRVIAQAMASLARL